MDSPTLRVIFDTNAYISLSSTSLEEVTGWERKAGVLTFASVWPCLELVAGCGSASPSKRRRAHSAVRKLATHVSRETAAGYELRLHEAGEFTLLRELFDATPQEPLLEIHFVCRLVAAAALESLESFCNHYRTDLHAVSERVGREEQRFATRMAVGLTGYGGGRIRSAAMTPVELALNAAGLVQALAEQYDIELTPDTATRAVNVLVQNFPVALAFSWGLLMDYSPSSGIPGGRISHWDLKVAFHASGGRALDAPALLVTDDERLLAAARNANDPMRVMRVSDYRALVSQPGEVQRRSDVLRRWER
jgi:hypothetical protein